MYFINMVMPLLGCSYQINSHGTDQRTFCFSPTLTRWSKPSSLVLFMYVSLYCNGAFSFNANSVYSRWSLVSACKSTIMSTLRTRCSSGLNLFLKSCSCHPSLAILLSVSCTSGALTGGHLTIKAITFTILLPTCSTCWSICSFHLARSIQRISFTLVR